MFLNLLKNNSEALLLLDWSQIISDVSSLSHFDITKNILMASPSFQKQAVIQNKLDQLEFFVNAYDELSYTFNTHIRLIPFEEEKFQTLPFLYKERFFDTNELNFFALLFSGHKDTSKQFFKIPLTEEYIIPDKTLDSIRREFLSPLRNFVDVSGKISYERHPELKNLYAKLLQLEHELRSQVLRVSQTELYKTRLQLENFDIINDRYVLAIRSDSYQASLGSIVSRSQSGMTLFVEPFELREKSNQRLQIVSEIESIILHLTINLSKIAHQFAKEFELISNAVLFFDLIYTKATYSLKNNFTKPILSNDFHIELRSFFHPLIEHPVSNNLELNLSQKGLILSGPNTGGKTVALKSVCLCMLFLQMGIYVPASHAVIYPVDGLYYFSHDHQNISQGLSSFSAEAKYYLSLLDELTTTNLIFIDEIFNSTSSEEASALAMALINEIHSISNSKLVISTHHQMLKTFMHNRQDYVSAHVGFDLERGVPTFKLLYGEPGNSLALTIFNNLSALFHTKTNISIVAQDYLDKKSLSYETLLLELSQKKIELDKLLQQQKILEQELKNQRSSMEGILFLEKEKILTDFNKKLKNVFGDAENLLNSIKEKKVTSKNTFYNQMAGITRELPNAKENKPFYNPYGHLSPIPLSEIQNGMTVFSLDFKKNVKVLQVNLRKKEVQIQQGALSSWVEPETLCFSSGKAIPKVSVIIEKSSRHDIEIDCRGMRLEEFQKVSELSINELIAGDIPFLTIIHGHGDGILKNWLRKNLKENYRDLRWENIEGNDGCTKIYLN
jgi:DNA mismatch repair protein MutS2